MGNCNGNCAECSGCGRELELTRQEVDVLQELAQIPFLPVVRKREDSVPVCPWAENPAEMSLVLQCLEKKGLILTEYDRPLSGYVYDNCTGYPVWGSFGLTAKGQQVLDLMEYQGIGY